MILFCAFLQRDAILLQTTAPELIVAYFSGTHTESTQQRSCKLGALLHTDKLYKPFQELKGQMTSSAGVLFFYKVRLLSTALRSKQSLRLCAQSLDCMLFALLVCLVMI